MLYSGCLSHEQVSCQLLQRRGTQLNCILKKLKTDTTRTVGSFYGTGLTSAMFIIETESRSLFIFKVILSSNKRKFYTQL